MPVEIMTEKAPERLLGHHKGGSSFLPVRTGVK